MWIRQEETQRGGFSSQLDTNPDGTQKEGRKRYTMD